MSPLGTVLTAWSAVYGYACVYFVLFWLRRHGHREFLAFGLMAGSLSLYCVARSSLVGATDPADTYLAAGLSAVGVFGLVAFLGDFCQELAGGRAWVRVASYAWAAVGAVWLVAAAIGQRGAPPHTLTRSLPWGGSLESVDVSGAVYAFAALGLLLAALSTMRLYSLARADSDARLIFITTALSVVAATYDLVVAAATEHGLTLLEHTSLAPVIAMTYVLLDRFARTGVSLALRTQELSKSYDELRETQEQLVRKEQLAAVGELSAVIAHEVRNPLAIIKNAVSGLRRTNLRPTDQTTLLSILDEETDKLNRLTHDLLAYARPVIPRGRALPVSDLIRRSLERARSGNPHSEDVAVVLELDPERPDIHGDPELLRHAIVNVVDNAFDAMIGGGTLTVRSTATTLYEQRAVALSFRDTGEGMDTVVRDKARAPFFTTRPSGTGLGLAIVERVVSNHGGRVEIESSHGDGTTVTLVLPCEHISVHAIPSPDAGAERLSAIREGV